MNDVGIYRDDCLISVPNNNRSLTSKIQKKVIRAFKYMELKIEVISKCEIINYLNVTLNLNDNSYKPFSKTNSVPTYINVCSNHSKPII